MVPPSSGQISRVCSYSGYCSLTSCFTYRTLTFFGWPSHVILLHSVILNAVQNPICIATNGLASSAFARHYSQNLVWFLFLRLLRCFSSAGSLPIAIWFTMGYVVLHHVGFPIRKSPDIMLISSSPRLIAGYRVLLRLLMPRHSSYALYSLNMSFVLLFSLAWVSQIIRLVIITLKKLSLLLSFLTTF